MKPCRTKHDFTFARDHRTPRGKSQILRAFGRREALGATGAGCGLTLSFSNRLSAHCCLASKPSACA